VRTFYCLSYLLSGPKRNKVVIITVEIVWEVFVVVAAVVIVVTGVVVIVVAGVVVVLVVGVVVAFLAHPNLTNSLFFILCCSSRGIL